MALNDQGQVTGYVNYGAELNYDLAIYSKGELTVMKNLSGLYPVAINDAGQIAGDTVFSNDIFCIQMVYSRRSALYQDTVILAQ